MSVINGMKQLTDFLGLHTGLQLANATSAQRTDRDALDATLSKLKEIENKSYAAMISNLDHVATNGWFENLHQSSGTYKNLESKKAAIMKDMQATLRMDSNLDHGFIIWLDYNRTSSANFVEKQHQRPRLLPILDNNEVIKHLSFMVIAIIALY